ncbi:hypothetical protein ACN469_11735 [Corallococcus terminator]
MRGILGGLLSVALLTGCGGMEQVEAETAAAPTEGNDVSAMSLCPTNYLLKYYDSTYTTLMGSVECECGSEPIFRGEITPYYKKYTLNVCP